MRTIQLVVLAPQICSCFLLKLSSKPKPTLRFMSLKPAATSLMDSGKALARSGEFLIDLTQDLDLYGGTYCMIAELSTSCFLNLILSRNRSIVFHSSKEDYRQQALRYETQAIPSHKRQRHAGSRRAASW
jgi:hypothetical protein